MKKLISILILSAMGANAFGCPVCERNQPKVLKGIVHGSGPDSQWDYLIIGIISAIVVITFLLSAKWLINPGENSSLHIKRTVLDN